MTNTFSFQDDRCSLNPLWQSLHGTRKSSHHAAHLKHTMLRVNDISVKLEEITKTQETCLCMWELNTKFGSEVAKLFST